MSQIVLIAVAEMEEDKLEWNLEHSLEKRQADCWVNNQPYATGDRWRSAGMSCINCQCYGPGRYGCVGCPQARYKKSQDKQGLEEEQLEQQEDEQLKRSLIELLKSKLEE